MSDRCAQHPEAIAAYRCDGCGRLLCEACIRESHVLVLCAVCGEMALPYAGGVPAPGPADASPGGAPALRPPPGAPGATVQARRKLQAISRPYPLHRALTYPLRGSGLGMFVATLVTLGFLWFLRRGYGCLPFMLTLGFTGMVVALQFKIVRTTAAGDDDLPDWPDFLATGTMVRDYLTWLVVGLLQLLLVGPFFLLRSHSLEALLAPPSYPFWLVASALLWVGAALSTMGFGAAGVFGRPYVLAIPSHVRAFRAAGGGAVQVANLAFAMSALTLMTQLLVAKVPWIGGTLSTIVSTYWVFTAPHLAGVLFRRHLPLFEQVYGAEA